MGCITRKGPLCPESLSLVWQRLFRIFWKKKFFFFFWKFLIFFFFFFFFFEKSVSAPVLLLVWQRLRPLGTFSRNAAHLRIDFQVKMEPTLPLKSLVLILFVGLMVSVVYYKRLGYACHILWLTIPPMPSTGGFILGSFPTTWTYRHF